MELYPAIDIRDGGAVRLTQGDFDRQSEYGDPLDLARRFVAGGAPWLHVVDLDAARLGRAANRSTVLAIAGAVEVPVQTGGGVRSKADVAELLEGGVARVVLGTVALDRPDLVATLAAAYPGRVAVGVDYRRQPDGRTEVAVRGWEQGSGRIWRAWATSWPPPPFPSSLRGVWARSATSPPWPSWRWRAAGPDHGVAWPVPSPARRWWTGR
jgi:phosphoribosylformimino-5-aminoimidazole carboxamide ribotide isomerase